MADVWTIFGVKTPAEARPDFSSAFGPHNAVQRMQEFLDQCLSGGRPASSISVLPNASAASQTITLASCPAGQVVEINGVRFTAVNGTAVAAYNEFDMSGNDTADAAALAAAINACTDARVSGVLTASSSLGVVTVTAARAGYLGNAIQVRNLGILASAVVTAASVQSGDTITINGTVLTATQHHATETLTLTSCAVGAKAIINGVSITAVASGANGISTFSQAGTDTQDAAALAAAINAHPSLAGLVTASSSAGVVTVRAVSAGTGGNDITIAASGTGITFMGSENSAGNLANGAAVANNQFDFTGSNTQCAADIVRAIGASTTALVSGAVTAKYTAGAVTITALEPGVPGNANQIATSNGTRLAITGSVSRLAGGTEASYRGTRATGTITITGADAGNYTATINGVSTGNVTGTAADDNATASSLCDAINKLTTALVADCVKATVASNVITITALRGGPVGNTFSLATTGTGAARSGALLTGGAVPTTVVLGGSSLGANTVSSQLSGGSSDTPISTSF